MKEDYIYNRNFHADCYLLSLDKLCIETSMTVRKHRYFEKLPRVFDSVVSNH